MFYLLGISLSCVASELVYDDSPESMPIPGLQASFLDAECQHEQSRLGSASKNVDILAS